MSFKTNKIMKMWVHSLISIILAALLYPVFNWKVLLILVGGILIDVDHYLWYIYKYKKINLLECYGHYTNQMKKNDFRENYGIILIFHTIEFLLIAVLSSFYNEVALMFAIGLLVHYVLDLVFLYTYVKRFIANHSIIHWIYKNKLKI